MSNTVELNIPKTAADRLHKGAEWQASFHGIPIHTDSSLPHGTIEFRDRAGKVIGTIIDVGGLHIGTRS